MDMCIAICEKSSIRTDINDFRHTVNDKAVDIIENYLHNIELFIVDEFNKDGIESFINKYININILRKKELIEICSRYNATTCSRNECEQCKKQHPFCMLYNVGLLGYIKNEEIIGKKTQYFLPPGYSLPTIKATLPKSELYFLHPAINDWLKIKMNCINIKDCKSFVIGDSKSITQEQIYEVIDEIKIPGKIFLSSANYYNEGFRHELCYFLKNDKKKKKVLTYEKEDFPIDIKLHPHDNCIKNVDICDMFVLVIDSMYGDKYSGILYLDDLQKQYGKEVNVTWAEYWRACELGKNVLIFIKESVFNDINSYKTNKEKGLSGEYNNPDGLLDFINELQHKRIGNWRYLYKDLNHLKKLLKEIIIDDRRRWEW
jgi:hypothetical protein